MALAGQIARAVKQAERALDDLAIDVTLVKREKVTYVPGQSQEHVEVQHITKGVIGKYTSKEIDGSMILAEDMQLLLFPPSSKAIPETNDLVKRNSPVSAYRVIHNQPIYAGSEIVFHVAQVRPV